MDIFAVLGLIGGLALFLFGMSVLGSGLEKSSGGRLERTLEKLTDSKLKAVGLGAGVTAVIQSSSATTVMVVGFVNSGIMKLSQAIGVIMGANIGTTATAWILSLAGIEGDNIFVKLLKPESFAPLIAIIGVIMLSMCKKDKNKDIGTILMGFAVLMMGMSAMSAAVKPLAGLPGFQNILLVFSNPIFGVIAGAVFTAVIQSSSASVGILQALATTGAVTYGTSIPIILGQNIGTCATALISCIGANKNAKRAAMVHFYFNLIGTLLFLGLFYIGNSIFRFAFVSLPVSAMGIAGVHTIFNVLATAVLLPLSGWLEKLAVLTVRDKPHKEEFPMLDERFLNTPGFAAEQCRRVTVEMAQLAEHTLLTAVECLGEYSEKLEETVRAGEDKLDSYEDRLGTYLVKLSRRELSDRDSNVISKLLHSISDFERIGDHSLNMLASAREMHEKGISFSPEALAELGVLTEALCDILRTAVKAFSDDDIALAGRVEPLEQVIDRLIGEVRDRHVARLKRGECTIELGFILSDVLANFERVSDHCSNIAVCVIRIDSSTFDTHSYLQAVKATGGEGFAEAFRDYGARYVLPSAGKSDAPVL